MNEGIARYPNAADLRAEKVALLVRLGTTDKAREELRTARDVANRNVAAAEKAGLPAVFDRSILTNLDEYEAIIDKR